MPKMMTSGKIISYLVVALLQTCLLDAKSLGVPRQSTLSEGGFIEIDIDQETMEPTTRTDSLCLPSEDQLQF